MSQMLRDTHPDLNHDRVRMLVEALRSDRFEQGHGKLVRVFDLGDGVRQERYCCLGVACVLAVENGVDVEVRDSGVTVTFDGQIGYMPRSVSAWYGFGGAFEHRNPSVDLGNGYVHSLAAMNDRSYTFTEIADAIEATYLTEPTTVEATP